MYRLFRMTNEQLSFELGKKYIPNELAISLGFKTYQKQEFEYFLLLSEVTTFNQKSNVELIFTLLTKITLPFNLGVSSTHANIKV